MNETSPLRAPRAAFLAVAALAVFAPGASAQQPAAAKPPVLAVLDMGRVSGDSLLGKFYAGELDKLRNEIEAERTKKQSDLNKLETAIKALQDEIDKQGQVLSPEALDKKKQDVIKKTRERDAFIEDGQQEIGRLQQRAQAQAQTYNNEFQAKIRPHIEAVVKERGIDILFDSQVTLSVTKAYDVSQEVIVKADDAERAAKAKPAAGAAPAPKNP